MNTYELGRDVCGSDMFEESVKTIIRENLTVRVSVDYGHMGYRNIHVKLCLEDLEGNSELISEDSTTIV